MDTTVYISDRQVDGCTVLDIRAENFTYPQSVALKNYVAHLIEQGEKFFVLNVNEVHLVDSYGLATIISVLKMTQERGGAIALYGLNETFTKLVKVTHLDRVLETWPSEAQATYYLVTTAKSVSKH
jgi:anti-sigma B factor antagonist